ncbi:MAG: response regulator [Nitrospira sp.]|jgi:DNA-binding NarL/FixJ family response regulator|nr:response regulator [Nitrospira sp.]
MVREASHGVEGIRLFHQAPTDPVITDIYMPEGDGLEVIRLLRQERPVLKILAVSGRTGQNEILTAAKLLGADGILLKPVGVEELRLAVVTLLSGTTTDPSP